MMAYGYYNAAKIVVADVVVYPDYPETGEAVYALILVVLGLLLLALIITAFIFAIIALVRTSGLNRRIANLEQQLFIAQNQNYNNNVNPNITNSNNEFL